MKKILLVLFAALTLGASAQNQETKATKQGQPERPTKEQMVESRCRKIMNDLALDDTKRAAFKPLYVEYCQKMDELRTETPRQKKDEKELTDADVEKMIKARFSHARKLLDLRETYYDKFRKVLSPRQIQRIYAAEQGDRQRVGQEMQRRGQQPRRVGQPGQRPAGGRGQAGPAPQRQGAKKAPACTDCQGTNASSDKK